MELESVILKLPRDLLSGAQRVATARDVTIGHMVRQLLKREVDRQLSEGCKGDADARLGMSCGRRVAVWSCINQAAVHACARGPSWALAMVIWSNGLAAQCPPDQREMPAQALCPQATLIRPARRC